MEAKNGNPFAAALLRASDHGFASMAVGQVLADRAGRAGRADCAGPEADFEAWRAQFQGLVQELAAALEEGRPEPFAAKVGWVHEAFRVRGESSDLLRLGLEELAKVLRESLPESAQRSLADYFQAAVAELDRSRTADPALGADGDPLDALTLEFLDAVHRGESLRAIEGVMRVVRSGDLTIEAALSEVLPRALREIGRRWFGNEASVAEEHFATFTTGRLLERILTHAPRAEPVDRTVILTMVEGDAHDLVLRIVAGFFELAGWRAVCLGASTPPADLVRMDANLEADLVVIGATLNTQRSAVASTLRALKAVRPGRPVVVGGAAFQDAPSPDAGVGADGLAHAPKDALELGRTLV